MCKSQHMLSKFCLLCHRKHISALSVPLLISLRLSLSLSCHWAHHKVLCNQWVMCACQTRLYTIFFTPWSTEFLQYLKQLFTLLIISLFLKQFHIDLGHAALDSVTSLNHQKLYFLSMALAQSQSQLQPSFSQSLLFFISQHPHEAGKY